MSSSRSTPALALVIYAWGAVALVVGLILGVAVSPILFLIAAVGAADLLAGRLIASGRGRPEAAPEDPVARAEADPSFNPYARED